MISPYLLSLICCTFIVIYLALACRARFLPGCPTLYLKIMLNFELYVFILSFFFFFVTFFYALFITFIQSDLLLAKIIVERLVTQQFYLKNRLIESLMLHHTLLEKALLESYRQSSEEKPPFFAFYNKNLKELLIMDKDFAIKTNPWWLVMESVISKTYISESGNVLISDNLQTENATGLNSPRVDKKEYPKNK